MEGQLQKDIAQLIRGLLPVFIQQGAGGLVGLLHQVLGQGGVGLLPVPGAAIRRAQDAHDGEQVLRVKRAAVQQGHREDHKAAGVVVPGLTVQVLKRHTQMGADGRLAGREEEHPGFRAKHRQQFQFHIARQRLAVEFHHAQGLLGIDGPQVHGAGDQHGALGHRGGFKGGGQGHSLQNLDLVRKALHQQTHCFIVGGVRNGIGQGCLPRQVFYVFHRLPGEGIKILRLVIQRVQAVKGDAFLPEQLDRAMARGSQQDCLFLFQLFQGAQGEKVQGAWSQGDDRNLMHCLPLLKARGQVLLLDGAQLERGHQVESHREKDDQAQRQPVPVERVSH